MLSLQVDKVLNDEYGGSTLELLILDGSETVAVIDIEEKTVEPFTQNARSIVQIDVRRSRAGKEVIVQTWTTPNEL